MGKSRGLRILLVGCPEAVIRAIEEGGHETVAPPNAASALRLVRSTPPDVVILDLAGAGGDPFDLARSLRTASLWRKPLFMAIAETENDEQERCCRNAGIDLLYFKPLDPSVVVDFLNRLLAVVKDYESFDPVI
jgi:DNA-binding response OmpR family regulator